MKNNFLVPDPSGKLISLANSVRIASTSLAQKSDEERKDALLLMADSLLINSQQIIKANNEDLVRSSKKGLSGPLLARLKLDQEKLLIAIDGIKKVACLPDPLSICQTRRELSEGLILERVTVPLGVLGIIFESRPDAAIQISALAIRSGNGAILKGGSEALLTNEILINLLKDGLSKSTINPNSLSLLTTREESLSLLKLDGYVDLIIPRGSNELVRFIQDNTRIPVLGHADGICHLYIDSEADIYQAINIAIDSKTQYPAACNSIETLLVHQDIARSFLNVAIPELEKLGVKLLGDDKSCQLGIKNSANEEDWSTEYLDLVLSVKIVESLDSAVEHIRIYSSRHTDAIVTESKANAKRFIQIVDSSGVFHNCSTRFADGFRYGFGAEVGISTQTLPPRGPVGLEGLVTYRYHLRGHGHIADDYISGKRVYTHKELKL